MPAPALKAAIIALRPKLEPAASATIETDQKLKNHRFHSTAMNARLISTRSRDFSTAPTSLLRRVKTKATSVERERDLEDRDPQVATGRRRRR